MINILKADLLKLRAKNFYMLFVILNTLIIWLLSSIVYIRYGDNPSLWLNNVVSYIGISTSIITLFAVLMIDDIWVVEKDKWKILWTKNIRVRYLLSKYIITILFMMISLILIFIWVFLSSYMISGDIIWVKDLWLVMLNTYFIYILSILPILLIYLIVSLIYFRAIYLFIWFFILSMIPWFLGVVLWGDSQISKIASTIDKYSIWSLSSNIINDADIVNTTLVEYSFVLNIKSYTSVLTGFTGYKNNLFYIWLVYLLLFLALWAYVFKNKEMDY